ncbi:MAG TPA: OmpH family outer membrane protein [Armatimonadaceae bacterium]|nr:OmpH family outer membrane protein [Armatimonadaceae bacterium]
MRNAFQRSVPPLAAPVLAAFLIGAVLAGPGAVRPARAQNNPAAAAAPTFGMIDVGKILNDSKARQAAATELQQFQQALVGILRRMDQGTARFLEEAEVMELGKLYEKTAQTDADKKRISDLEQKGDLSKGQLTRLQNVASPTPEQNKELQDLADRQEKGAAHLQKYADSLDKQLKDRERSINTKMMDDVKTAVAKVAKQKNLAAVFTGDVAIYAPVDITNDVLKEINK